MIFVTVGTTHFDPLIRHLDELSQAGKIKTPILFQIGAGTYEPKNGRFFRFKPSISEELSNAELVITHGGATVFSLLAMKKKFVAIANTSLDGNHQARFLKFLGAHSTIIWTDCLRDIYSCISKATLSEPATLETPSLAQDIEEYLSGTD